MHDFSTLFCLIFPQAGAPEPRESRASSLSALRVNIGAALTVRPWVDNKRPKLCAGHCQSVTFP